MVVIDRSYVSELIGSWKLFGVGMSLCSELKPHHSLIFMITLDASEQIKHIAGSDKQQFQTHTHKHTGAL